MAVTIWQEEGITVLAPEGKLLGGSETDEFEAQMKELDQAGNARLVLDMSGVTFMTSLAIAAVIRAHIRYSKRGGRIKICALDRHIRHIFDITKLSCVFRDDLHDTVADGIASFHEIAAH